MIRKINQKTLTVLPNQQLLQQIWEYLLTRPNKRGELKKEVNECLFLLGWKVGLRVSEAISFDLNLENQDPRYKNCYFLRGKRQKERWVFVDKQVVKELQSRHWEPQQITRQSFYACLQNVKKELGIAQNIELAPHTLRRCFATYQAISGMPLPVLQKILGHASLNSTSLYVRAGDLDNLVKFRPV